MEVEIKIHYNGFTVRFHRHDGKAWTTDVSANDSHDGTHDGTHEETVQKETYEDAIISMVKENNKITRKEMAEKLSISLRSLQRIINTMDDLYYVGSGNHGHWEIRGGVDHDYISKQV